MHTYKRLKIRYHPPTRLPTTNYFPISAYPKTGEFFLRAASCTHVSSIIVSEWFSSVFIYSLLKSSVSNINILYAKQEMYMENVKSFMYMKNLFTIVFYILRLYNLYLIPFLPLLSSYSITLFSQGIFILYVIVVIYHNSCFPEECENSKFKFPS